MSHVSTSTSILLLPSSSTCSETTVSKQVYCFTKLNFRILIFFLFPAGGRVVWSSFSLTRLILLGLSVLVNVAAALAPFIISGHLHQALCVKKIQGVPKKSSPCFERP